jgi:hypothetical protein
MGSVKRINAIKAEIASFGCGRSALFSLKP